jgi:hypothetical protein
MGIVLQQFNGKIRVWHAFWCKSANVDPEKEKNLENSAGEGRRLSKLKLGQNPRSQ